MMSDNGRRPTILLLEEDDETRPLLKGNLQSFGYRVVVALDEEDALDRVSGGQLLPDLILVDLIDKTAEEVLEVARHVGRHAGRGGRTPVVVMPERYGADVEGTEVNVNRNEWVLYLGDDPGQLQNLLARILGNPPTLVSPPE